MEVPTNLSREGEAVRLLTEDRASGNQSGNPWEISSVDNLALRRDGTGF